MGLAVFNLVLIEEVFLLGLDLQFMQI